MLGSPCRIFFADNPQTYFAIYPGREWRGRELISFQVMTRQTASQAIYFFIPTSSTRTPPLLVFAPVPSLRLLLRSSKPSQYRTWIHGPLCSGLILISRCHDIYHLGVLALLTGASGICFSFLQFLRSMAPSSSRRTRGTSQAWCVLVVKKQYRLSLSHQLLAQLARLAMPS